ncbi:MAG: carbohydrate ABC transporter permease [Bacilli bacterium]
MALKASAVATRIRPARRRWGWRTRSKWSLLLPAILFVAVMTQAPFAMAIWYSLLNWNFLNPTNIFFAGLRNYQYIFADPTFTHAIFNTVTLTGGSVVVSILVGLPLALLMDLDIPGKQVLRLLMITPFFVMSAVNAVLWKDLMFDPNFGLVDWLLKLIGIGPIDFMTNYPRQSIIFMTVWQWSPFMMLITLAGLQSLPIESLEAARVDGATKWKEFVHIMLPHLRKYLEIELFLGIIMQIQMFGRIYISTQGGPGNQTTNLAYYAYLQGFSQWNVGEAAAVGILAVIVTTLIATLLFRLIMRFSLE